MRKRLAVCVLAAAAFGWCSSALPGQDVETLVKEIFAVPCPTGYENVLAAKLQGLMPKEWRTDKDNLGSVYAFSSARSESGLVVAVPLDEFGYLVSGIARDGYLRIDRPVPPPVPIFDSFLIGHVMSVTTKKGTLQAIVGLPSMHIMTRDMRERLSRGVSLDDIYLDIGVRSEEEAREKGVEILDPVTPWPEMTELEGKKWAGPSLGVKSAIAAVSGLFTDLKGKKPSGDTVLVWMAQTRFPSRSQEMRASLGALRMKNRLKPSQVILVDTIATDKEGIPVSVGKGPVLVQQARDTVSKLRQRVEGTAAKADIPLQSVPAYESPLANPFLKDTEDFLVIGIPVKFKGTMSEVVDLRDVRALKDLLLQVIR